MIIERDLTPYVVYSGDPVLRALEKITANQARVIFLVDSHGHLDGVLSIRQAEDAIRAFVEA